MVKRELSPEKIVRLRTWLFLGVVVCGAMIVGLSNAVWSSSCPGGTVLGLNSFFVFCGPVTGTESHVVFGFGDGIATLGLGLAILATCALAFGLQKNVNANAMMLLATAPGLFALVIVAIAAFTFMADEGRHATQSLLLLLAVTTAAPILSAAFVWLDQAYQNETSNGDNEAWA